MTTPAPIWGNGWELRALIARHRWTTNVVEADVLAVMRNVHSDIARELRASSISKAKRARLVSLGSELEQMLQTAWPEAKRKAISGMSALADVERASAIARFGPSHMTLDGLSASRLVAVAGLPATVEDIAIGGVGFGEWWTKGVADAVQRVQREMQYGLALGESSEAIASRIYTARDARGETGGAAWKGTRSALRMVIRTLSTAITSRATLANAAAAGITQVRFDAVMDDRTSAICAVLDGEIWEMNDPKLPIPPLHPNCRSALTPMLGEWDPAVFDMMPARKRYEDWLKEQDEATQNRVLGKGRADLWRSGAVKLADLIDTDRRPITLARLNEQLTTQLPAGPVLPDTSHIGAAAIPDNVDVRTAMDAPDSRWNENLRMVAQREGVDVDDLRRHLDATVKDTLAPFQPWKRIKPDAFESVLDGGEALNQYVTGHSNGSYDPMFRQSQEDKLFGYRIKPGDYPEKEDGLGMLTMEEARQRPVYGYVTDDPDGRWRMPGRGWDPVSQYGSISVKLKPHVRKRTTIMFGDSLGLAGYEEGTSRYGWEYGVDTFFRVRDQPVKFDPGSLSRMAVPLDNVTGHAYPTGMLPSGNPLTKQSLLDSMHQMSYIEAQYHGAPISIGDIEEVVFSDPDDATTYLLATLDRLRIPYRILP